MVTPFTRDFERLARIVERRRDVPVSVTAELARRDTFAPGTRGEAAVLDWLLAGDQARDFLRPILPSAIGTPEVAGMRLSSGLYSALIGSDLLKAAAGIELLRYEPGEKRLILVSLYGISSPWEHNVKGAITVRSAEEAVAFGARAANAGIALELIITIGTERGLAWANAMQTMQSVASESGGEFASVRTVGQQMERIDEASRHGYIIGYAPTNPAFDATRRHLTIDVNRRDVTLIYRRAYTAQRELPPLDLRQHITRVRLEEAALAPIDFSDIQIRASARMEAGGLIGPRVRVELTIDPRHLALADTAGVREGTFDLLVLCGDRRGETIGSVAQRMALRLDQATWDTALKSGVLYTVVVPVAGRPMNAKVLIYSFDNDRMGSVSLTIR